MMQKLIISIMFLWMFLSKMLFSTEIVELNTTVYNIEKNTQYTLSITKETVVRLAVSYAEYSVVDASGKNVSLATGEYDTFYGSGGRAKLSKGNYTISIFPYSNIFDSDLSIDELPITHTSTNIEVNKIVNGTWSLSSVSAYSPYNAMNQYKLTLKQQTAVNIKLQRGGSYENSPVIFVLDSAGKRILAHNGGYHLSSVALMGILDSGEYTIQVTTQAYYPDWVGGQSSDRGGYTLSIEPIDFSATSIVFNTTYSATLTQDSPKTPYFGTPRAIEYFKFTLEEDTEVVANITSALNTKSILFTEDGGIIDIRDKLPAGVYYLGITTYPNEKTPDEDTFGDFSIELRKNIVNTRPIEMNSSMNGEFTDISGFNRYGKKVERYTFDLEKRTAIHVDINSSINTRIFVDGKDVNWFYFLDLFLLDSGTHTIEIESSNNELGPYVISLSQKHPNFNKIEVNGKGMNSSELLDPSYPLGKNNGTADHYLFTVKEYEKINIYTTGDIDYRYINIFDENYQKQPSIEGEFRSHHSSISLNPGTYILEVLRYSSEEYYIKMYSGTEKPSPIKVIDEEIGTREVTIQWDNTASHITEYRVYLNGELVDYLSPKENSYTFDFLQLNTTYSYEIRAFNVNGASLKRGTFKTKKDDYAWLIPIYGIIL